MTTKNTLRNFRPRFSTFPFAVQKIFGASDLRIINEFCPHIFMDGYRLFASITSGINEEV